MQAPKIIQIPVDRIKIPRGRRPLSDISQLTESIARRGLLNPITVSENHVLIAGLHRLSAVKRLGWKKITAHVMKMAPLEAKLAEIDENLMRMDLTVLERVEQLEERKKIYETIYPEAQRPRGGRPRNDAESAPFSQQVSVKTGIAQRTIQEELQIATRLELAVREKIRTSPVADNKSELLRLCRLPADQQKRIAIQIAQGAKSMREATTLARQKGRIVSVDLPMDFDKRCRLLHGDYLEKMKGIKAASVGLLFTDPPYGREYLSLYEGLAKAAPRVLKPGASLLVMTGQSYLPEILNLMTKHMTYNWTLCFIMAGNHPRIWQRKIMTGWKPILHFSNGPYKGKVSYDVIRSAPEEKKFHAWQQSQTGINELVDRFSNPGDTILDTFVGSGTFGAVTVRMGRYFVGIDSDAGCIKTTKIRISEALSGKG